MRAGLWRGRWRSCPDNVIGIAPPPTRPAGRALIGRAAADAGGAGRGERRGGLWVGKVRAALPPGCQWVAGCRPRAGSGRLWGRRRCGDRVQVSGPRRGGRARTGFGEARGPPRPQTFRGRRVGALGRRWPPGVWTAAGWTSPAGLVRGPRSRARDSGVLGASCPRFGR